MRLDAVAGLEGPRPGALAVILELQLRAIDRLEADSLDTLAGLTDGLGHRTPHAAGLAGWVSNTSIAHRLTLHSSRSTPLGLR